MFQGVSEKPLIGLVIFQQFLLLDTALQFCYPTYLKTNLSKHQRQNDILDHKYRLYIHPAIWVNECEQLMLKMPDEGGLWERLVLVGLGAVPGVEADKGGHAALPLCRVAARLNSKGAAIFVHCNFLTLESLEFKGTVSRDFICLKVVSWSLELTDDI